MSVPIPVCQDVLTVVFADLGRTFTFNVGHLDPIHTRSGIVHRLQNLGYLPFDADLGDLTTDDSMAMIRSALRALKVDQSAPQSSEDASSTTPEEDDAGLSDDGTLDDATSKLLRSAHPA